MKHLLWIAVVAAFACKNDKSKDTPKAMDTQTPAGATPSSSAGPSAPKTPDKESESPDNAAAVAVNKLDTCTLITTEEATEIIGMPMKRLASGGEQYCKYESEDASKGASLDIEVKGDGAGAIEGATMLKGHEKFAGVGDDAVFNGAGRIGTVAIRKGTRAAVVSFSLGVEGDSKPAAQKIAAKVAERLN